MVPVAIDSSLPDYLVRTDTYGERMRVLWQPGDRFRMFFGGKISSKTHKKVKTGEEALGRVALCAACQHAHTGCWRPALWLPSCARSFAGTGGSWRRGHVHDLVQAQPGPDAPLRAKESYDPWESVVVQWDRGACAFGGGAGGASYRRHWSSANCLTGAGFEGRDCKPAGRRATRAIVDAPGPAASHSR